jgi:thymidine kinase
MSNLDLLNAVELPAEVTLRLTRLESDRLFELFDKGGFAALKKMIAFALQSGWSENEIIKFFFEPIKPDSNSIESFRNRHQQIYYQQAIDLANQINNSTTQFFIISSSMYAGKSTLAAEVCDQLRPQGYRVIPMVPFFMSDDGQASHITLRGRETRVGDAVGRDGFTQIKALCYYPAQIESIFQQLNIARDEKVVIHFDEFSFLDSGSIGVFVEYVTQNYPNIKVLFVGLNRNALGAQLPGYIAAKNTDNIEVTCKSFVPNSIDSQSQDLPTGTFTSRYVILPNGVSVLDCGFLPVAVPKEFASLVYYTPSNSDRHFHNMLIQMQEDTLLSGIVEPNASQLDIRKALFEELKLLIEQ